MKPEYLLYVLLAMLAYDFSVHVIYLLKKQRYFLQRKVNYWPEWEGTKYQIFWASFWGIGLVVLVLYILTSK